MDITDLILMCGIMVWGLQSYSTTASIRFCEDNYISNSSVNIHTPNVSCACNIEGTVTDEHHIALQPVLELGLNDCPQANTAGEQCPWKLVYIVAGCVSEQLICCSPGQAGAINDSTVNVKGATSLFISPVNEHHSAFSVNLNVLTSGDSIVNISCGLSSGIVSSGTSCNTPDTTPITMTDGDSDTPSAGLIAGGCVAGFMLILLLVILIILLCRKNDKHEDDESVAESAYSYTRQLPTPRGTPTMSKQKKKRYKKRKAKEKKDIDLQSNISKTSHKSNISGRSLCSGLSGRHNVHAAQQYPMRNVYVPADKYSSQTFNNMPISGPATQYGYCNNIDDVHLQEGATDTYSGNLEFL